MKYLSLFSGTHLKKSVKVKIKTPWTRTLSAADHPPNAMRWRLFLSVFGERNLSVKS